MLIGTSFVLLLYIRNNLFHDMTELDIKKYRSEIIVLIKEARLYEAFSSFSKLLHTFPNWEISEELSKLQTSYKYMLSYMAQGASDPQKELIYTNLLISLYSLIDRYSYHLLSIYSHSQYNAIKQDFVKTGDSLRTLFDNFNTEYKRYKLYASIPDNEINENKILELKINVEKAETRLFNYVWTAFDINEEDLTILTSVMTDTAEIPENLRALLLSAMFLNINYFYNEHILLLLFSIASYNRNNDELAVRAMCCIFLILHKYNYITTLSKDVTDRLNELKQDAKFRNAIELISLQFIRSCDTEKLTRMVHDELLPGLMNASSGLLKNFKDKKPGNNDIIDLESNPEWEEFLEKSGIADKIKEINEIQMEGGDIFMGTFSKLKTFSFFRDVANWFIPFDINHSHILSSPVAKNKLITNIITHAKFLCDSDRFSFCLSINSMPVAQRNAMLAQFDSQNEIMDEIKTTAINDSRINIKQIITNYMQDVYRFFKLYEQRNEFEDPFNGNLLNTTLLSDVICSTENLSLIGEYYLKNKYFDLALPYFKKEIEISNNYQPSILQKTGFCYQNLKLYGDAIEYYTKFDLFDNSNLWNIKHLAASYKALGNFEKALDYYRRAEDISPDNLSICLNIGHCLLELNKIDEALKYYYKVDYLSQSNIKALRPIAWCLFLQKNFTQSNDYYKKIIATEPSAEDFMNLGHLKLAQNDMKDAICSYKESFKLMGGDFRKFSDIFNNDRKYIMANGISDNDIALVLDIIHYNL